MNQSVVWHAVVSPACVSSDLDNRGFAGSLQTVGPDLGSLVGSRQTVGPDSGSCHSMVGWILGLRPESGGGSLTVASAGFVYLRADWLQKLGGAEQHWRRCWFRRP